MSKLKKRDSDPGLIKIGARVPYVEWRELDDLLPWGLKQYLLGAIIKLVLDAIKSGGPATAGAIVAGHYRLVPDNEAAIVRRPDSPTGEQMS